MLEVPSDRNYNISMISIAFKTHLCYRAPGLDLGARGRQGPGPGPGAIFPNLENQISKTVPTKSGMSTFGVKTKVVRTEILHILVPMGSRGDPYLTVSRTFKFWTKFEHFERKNATFFVQF